MYFHRDGSSVRQARESITALLSDWSNSLRTAGTISYSIAAFERVSSFCIASYQFGKLLHSLLQINTLSNSNNLSINQAQI